MRNVSIHGIGLFLTQTLEPGTLVDVELLSRSIVNRVARVVHDTKREGGWLIDCSRLRAGSASVLSGSR